MKVLYFCTRFLAKTFFCLFYFHRVYGIEHFLAGKGIIAPNHASFFDPPLVGVSWPEEISYLARKTLFRQSLFRWLITQLNAYPVSGSYQDLKTIKLICHLLEENKKVVIFPEGIRSMDGNLSSIKSGIGMLSQRCHCPVIPAYIHSYEVWNRHRSFPKLWGKTACVFGSPIFPGHFSHLEKKEAQEAIALRVKESITALRDWYLNGAKGAPP